LVSTGRDEPPNEWKWPPIRLNDHLFPILNMYFSLKINGVLDSLAKEMPPVKHLWAELWLYSSTDTLYWFTTCCELLYM